MILNTITCLLNTVVWLWLSSQTHRTSKHPVEATCYKCTRALQLHAHSSSVRLTSTIFWTLRIQDHVISSGDTPILALNLVSRTEESDVSMVLLSTSRRVTFHVLEANNVRLLTQPCWTTHKQPHTSSDIFHISENDTASLNKQGAVYKPVLCCSGDTFICSLAYNWPWDHQHITNCHLRWITSSDQCITCIFLCSVLYWPAFICILACYLLYLFLLSTLTYQMNLITSSQVTCSGLILLFFNKDNTTVDNHVNL
jgi:hypothetical protein